MISNLQCLQYWVQDFFLNHNVIYIQYLSKKDCSSLSLESNAATPEDNSTISIIPDDSSVDHALKDNAIIANNNKNAQPAINDNEDSCDATGKELQPSVCKLITALLCNISFTVVSND